jgi:hypothetical protein
LIFAPIAAHQAAYDHVNAMKSESPGWEQALHSQLAAWRTLVVQVLTTLAGVSGRADYVLAYPDNKGISVNDGMRQALVRIATALRAVVSPRPATED